MRLIRYGLAGIAIVVCAWFAIGVRQAHDVNAATTLLSHEAGNSASATRRTSSLLSSASFLYPGVDVALLRARLEMERHNYPKAKALVDQSVASEPHNVSAWIMALDLSFVDPTAEKTKEVLAHLRVNDPIGLREATGH